MQRSTSNQKGSLLIEMIAVIGLLALVTPILFQQIQRRNEEIINAQIATEMRMIKDGAAAFIQANEADLAQGAIASGGCNLWDSANGKYANVGRDTPHLCSGGAASPENFTDYLPGTGSVNFANDYNVYFYGYTVPSSTTEYRPVIYGIVAQRADAAMNNLRRAAKVAALIGLEGGVLTGGSVKGMQGAWEITLPTSNGGPTENSVIAVTSFDDATNSAILENVKWQHLKTTTSSTETAVATRMGVTDILSVDDGASCITDLNNNTVTVNATSDTGSTCTPFFEVNPTTKEVRLKGVIKTGITTNATCTSGTSKASCEAIANCVWVSSANDNAGACVGEYLLNPSETSMVEDIKLTSRGGARLSDILPTWILKDVYYKAYDADKTAKTCCFGSGCSTSGLSANCRVVLPTCPTGYNAAITVVPSMTQQGYAQTSSESRDDHLHTGTPTGLLNGLEIPIGISGGVRYLVGTNEGLDSNIQTTSADIQVQTWMMGGSAGWRNVSDEDLNDFSLLIQTYCVFVDAAN